MGTAPRANRCTIIRFLKAFAVGAIAMAMFFVVVGSIDGSVGAMPETKASTAVVNDTSTEYRCYGDRDQLTQSAQKNFFQRNSFVRISATEYVSTPRTIVHGKFYAKMSVLYRSDICGFVVSHKYVPSTDELRAASDKMPRLAYVVGNRIVDGPRSGACNTVLPPRLAIARDNSDVLLADCLDEI